MVAGRPSVLRWLPISMLTALFRQASLRMAAALLAAGLVASCETTGGEMPVSGPAPPDIAIERVILQAYRAIGDRHIFDPDFRKIAPETWRGFASADPTLKLQMSEQAVTLLNNGKEFVSRPLPPAADDGRAWGGLMAELLAASLEESATLRQSDRQSLLRGAMSATTKLLDRNSRYADPDEARENRFQRDGGGGVGITVERTDDKKIIIRNVQDNSPASRAGLQVGDQIIGIDGDQVGDKPLSEVVHRLRGPVGAPLSMTVLRAGSSVTAELRRGRIIPTTVLYERRGDLAHIRLIGFNSATTETLRTTLDKARADIGPSLSGIIIDMRGNRGGLLDQALSVSEVFISEGPVFATQGRHPDSRRNYRSAGRKGPDTPLVVLVNGHSASAAEIVAAALQDRGRAVVVGTTSYGKGTVQTVVRLANEGELILTWSRLLAPSGYTWNELGVLPNICSAKVSDIATMNADATDTRSSLMRWHAMRNPTPEEISTARRICPPGDGSPERDLDIAARVLGDRDLYARAVRAGADQALAK
jgi:carboxyl-terminal processing protease